MKHNCFSDYSFFILKLFLGIIIGYYANLYVCPQFKVPCANCKEKYSAERMDNQLNQKRNCKSVFCKSSPGTVYIGVMSAKKFTDTRIHAAINTWMNHLPCNVKVDVFADNNGTFDPQTKIRYKNISSGINVIQLPGVSDDMYPPQKKSFSMLKFMHDMYIDKFDWFVRLDDDAYIDTELLLKLLVKINSSKSIYLGHVGFGLHKEDYLSRLNTYCMGGPGIMFSNALLRLVAPKLKHCLTHLLTEHEDIELGRCIKKMTGVTCTLSLECLSIFYQDFFSKTGNITKYYKLDFDKSITFHPNKHLKQQNKLHMYKLQHKLMKLHGKLVQLGKEIHNLENSTDKPHWASNSRADITWIPIETVSTSNRKVFKDIFWNLKNIVKQRKNKFGKKRRLRKLVNEATYRGIDPSLTVNFISKIRARSGKKVKKTRHYLVNSRYDFAPNLLLSNEPRDLNEATKKRQNDQRRHIHTVTWDDDVATAVSFLVRFVGKADFFFQFLSNFENAYLKSKRNVNLIAMIRFPSNNEQSEETTDQSNVAVNEAQNRLSKDGSLSDEEWGRLKEGVKYLQTSYPKQTISFATTQSCWTSLTKSVSKHEKDEILCLVDAGMTYTLGFLWHVRQNTIRAKRACISIPIRQYDSQSISPRVLSIYRSDLLKIDHLVNRICRLGVDHPDVIASILSSGLTIFEGAYPAWSNQSATA